jgi:hypothetical protein
LFLKCSQEGDENVDYFNSLVTKLMNTKYRHLCEKKDPNSLDFEGKKFQIAKLLGSHRQPKI